MSSSRHGISMGTFIVGALLAVTLIAQALTFRMELNRDIDALNVTLSQQKPLIDQAQRLTQQLESIAGATAKLAEQGNPNAILIRDQLQAQGVSIRPR